jgi:ribosomal protein S18 acetylase RimI-like enzyme
MPLRPFRVSTDFVTCAEIIPRAFRYPENPSWDMQDDDLEYLIGMFANLARIWPLIKLAQAVIPMLRDYIQGYVWEEKGQPVGIILLRREEKTITWTIEVVAVLPDYRRQGIGRRLVEAGLDLIRERKGAIVRLAVIAENVPAYALYRQMGFEPFESCISFDYVQDEPPPEIACPSGYTSSRFTHSDWHCSYDLALHITPTEVQRYHPIHETQYRPTLSKYMVEQIEHKAGGLRKEKAAVHTLPEEQVVAVANYWIRTRPGGINRIHIRFDPAHAVIAPYLLGNSIRTVQSQSPGRRIHFAIPHWQSAEIEAARATGCVERLEYHRMGIVLTESLPPTG